MNKHILSVGLAALGSAALLTPQTSSAQFLLSNFYLRADGGGNWLLNENVKDFFGPVAPGTKVKFDNGGTVGVTAGYEFTDFLAGEVQTEFIGNHISSVDGGDAHRAGLVNVPFLVNLKLQAPDNLFGPQYHLIVVPYIGGGGGFSESIFDADGHFTLNDVTVHGSQADTVWAAQAFGGLRWKLNPQMSISAEYRYLVTGDPRWSTDINFGGPDSFSFTGAQSHSVLLSFQFNF